jgi:Fe-S-cluster containining protein
MDLAMDNPAVDVWFKDGLKFRCTMCGDCCTGAPGVVWVNDEEVAAISGYIGETQERFLEWYTRMLGDRRSLVEKDNGDCIFFERGKGCTVYPVRPRQCRTWPFWESNLRTETTWRNTCKACPGSGVGELFSAEDIVKRMKVIKI